MSRKPPLCRKGKRRASLSFFRRTAWRRQPAASDLLDVVISVPFQPSASRAFRTNGRFRCFRNSACRRYTGTRYHARRFIAGRKPSAARETDFFRVVRPKMAHSPRVRSHAACDVDRLAPPSRMDSDLTENQRRSRGIGPYVVRTQRHTTPSLAHQSPDHADAVVITRIRRRSSFFLPSDGCYS